MTQTPLLSVGEVDENKEKSLYNNNDKDKLTFRNKPIEWTTTSEIKTRTITSVFDGEPEQGYYTGTDHLISYEGQEYTREQFYKTYFEDYKKEPYKVKYNNDNVLWLGSNQRAKLQYHILALNFPLVEVSTKDKRELEQFAASHNGETAQRWFNRMKWEQGHEKLITFGAALDVRIKEKDSKGKVKYISATKGLYCYESKITDEKAEYKGICMDWEQWGNGIKSQIDKARNLIHRLPAEIYNKDKELKQAMTAMYYQQIINENGYYLTLQEKEITKIKAWIYKYYKDGKAEFPYKDKGKIPNADVQFTIDFAADVEIIRAFDGVRESNKQRGKNISKNNADQLPEGELHRDEIISLCGKGKFDRMVSNKDIVHVKGKPGYYQRKPKQTRDFV